MNHARISKILTVFFAAVFCFGPVGLAADPTNTLTGTGAGASLTTGTYNSLFGYQAGYSTTTGNSNTFSGYKTGRYNTTGGNNTFSGYKAGYSNTTGYANIFSGDSAGYKNTTGYKNTFSGFWAGYSNTTGHGNTFSGNTAGYANTTGNNNTFSGNAAGYSNTTGNNNTFSGYGAGIYNTTGHYNTFSGNAAGVSNTTGYSNTFSGCQAGYSNTTGYANTFSGDGAGYFNTTGHGNVFIGYEAGFNETGSNKLYIANSEADGSILIYGDFSTGRVGIGTKSPGAKLHVAGQVKITGGSPGAGKVLTSDATGLATWQTTAGTGDNLGNHIATKNVRLNGFWLSGDGGNEGIYITNNGNIGIGTKTPAGRVDINGSIYQRGDLLEADYVFEPGYKLESIDEHSKYMWREKHLPAMPKMQKDENGQEIVEIGARGRGIVEELEKAHIYIEQLNKENKELHKENKELHKENKELWAELAGLDARLNAMESLVAKLSPRQ